MFIKKEYGLNKKTGTYCSGTDSILQRWKSSGPTPPLKRYGNFHPERLSNFPSQVNSYLFFPEGSGRVDFICCMFMAPALTGSPGFAGDEMKAIHYTKDIKIQRESGFPNTCTFFFFYTEDSWKRRS